MYITLLNAQTALILYFNICSCIYTNYNYNYGNQVDNHRTSNVVKYNIIIIAVRKNYYTRFPVKMFIFSVSGQYRI